MSFVGYSLEPLIIFLMTVALNLSPSSFSRVRNVLPSRLSGLISGCSGSEVLSLWVSASKLFLRLKREGCVLLAKVYGLVEVVLEEVAIVRDLSCSSLYRGLVA